MTHDSHYQVSAMGTYMDALAAKGAAR